MAIIDSQIHAYEANTPKRPWKTVPDSPPSATGDEHVAAMDKLGVDGAILHPPSWDLGSNEMADAACTKYPDRFCSLGWFPLNDPSQRSRIETWKQRPNMMGLRWALTRPEQQTWHEDGTMDWLWPAAEKAGTPVATMAWRFLKLFAQIAERHPNLKLIVDHLGTPRNTKDEAAFADMGDLLALAKYPNVALKASEASRYETGPASTMMCSAVSSI